jgi:putative DNA primase/helicase
VTVVVFLHCRQGLPVMATRSAINKSIRDYTMLVLNRGISAKQTTPASQCGNELQRIALDYLANGISIVPIRLDGSKASSVVWKEYQSRKATPDEVMRWFARPHGIGIITGDISGGLEVIDFDDADCFEPWRTKTSGIIERLPVVETGSGGYHVFYRCRHICPSTKIAMFGPNNGDAMTKATRIETRGQGGYVIGVGSPAEVHASRSPYIQVLGPPLPDIPVIEPDERKRLWEVATSFDKSGRVSQKVEQYKRALRQERFDMQAKGRPSSGGIAPWDDFDRRASWTEILEPAGWQQVADTKWRRPGKQNGISASVVVNDDGIEVLTCFSSNAPSIAASGSRSSWGKFRAYAAIYHNGDGKAAARAIAKLGYGSRKEVQS